MPIEISTEQFITVIKALNINAPIYKAIELEDGSIEITTRHGTQTWTPPPAPGRTDTTPQPTAGRAETEPDDLTTAPGIGEATADKLKDKGISTFAQLVEAIDTIDGMLDTIPPRYRSEALQWLYQQQGE